MEPVLEVCGITKRYPLVVANDDISFSVSAGSVHALLGENGAGKSTLMNILYGSCRPDSGEIRVDGKTVRLCSPRDAIANGIGMVHQHFMLVPALTVLENMVLAMNRKDTGWVFSPAAIQKKIETLAGRYHFSVDLSAKVCDLSVGQQQRAEIIKALLYDCRVLILDEPTAVLTPPETEDFLEFVREFARAGGSVIFISHKLQEVLSVSDTITVLRAGRVVGTISAQGCDPDTLVRMMVGKELTQPRDSFGKSLGNEVLRVEHLYVNHHSQGRAAVNDVNLQVRAGEFYGIAGVDGNGQNELAQCIASLTRPVGGTVWIEGMRTESLSPGRVLELGVAHIPEDRRRVGLVMSFSVSENLIFRRYRNKSMKSRFGFLSWKKADAFASDLLNRYQIRAGSVHTPAQALSGGNQQKLIVARELETNPRLLIAVHLTRGVDIGAVEYIHEQLLCAKEKGCAILLISTELEELVELSDRIGVMYGGQIVREFSRGAYDLQSIGRCMTGKES